MSQEETKTEKRPYEPPQVQKQENLKEITLFTGFGPRRRRRGRR